METSRKVTRQAPALLRPSPSGSVRRRAARARGEADPADYYELAGDPARHFLKLRLMGVWDQAVFDAFARDYLRTVRTMIHSGGVSHALVDASDFGFQSPDITERFPELILQGTDRAHRTAIVISALVNKVQAKRAGELLDARYFRGLGEATDWLFGNEA
jgi:hypothetical protein